MESPVQYLQEKIESMEKSIIRVQTEPLYGDPETCERARVTVTEQLKANIEKFRKAIQILCNDDEI